ncbi:MAG: uroporphyrinogen-III synthase [Gammaproteobacteria bacterium]|nr:uroporphyrinogen-III synthase [Gammaproteobacteria bacterium]
MSKKIVLNNKNILVTRPEGLADSLLQRIRDAGGTAHHYPVLRICTAEDSKILKSIIDNLSDFDIAIFISPTAVQKTFEKIKSLPEHLIIAVIGRSTETMLNKFGIHAHIVPADFNSESLLLHPDLQTDNIKNKSVVIFRGIGGRDLLGSSLIQRGAKVTYAEIYKREKNPLISLTQQQLKNIDILTVTSNESLQNLYDLTDNDSRPSLTLLPIVVPGIRAQMLAKKLGFKTVITSNNATDDACMQSLLMHFSH